MDISRLKNRIRRYFLCVQTKDTEIASKYYEQMSDDTGPTIIEERFADQAIGVELEQVSEGEELLTPEIEPWDPDKIRVSTKSFSLRNVLDMIDDQSLELAPDFQRNRVWKKRQKSRLIESLLLQIPLPAFYFAEDKDGLLRVIDGLQRLSTIHSYVRTEPLMVLADLEYLKDEEGKQFGQLSQALQRRLLNAQLVVHVIDPSTPDDVKYDIFKRINTGGEPLNAMEIRHCMSRARSRDFLRRCSHSEVFDLVTGGTLKDHIRMMDREAILRFVAFHLLNDIGDYDNYGTLESLLDWAVKRLDDPSDLSDLYLESLFQDFESAMSNAMLLFGPHAFRKWPDNTESLNPINRALFESWSVTLANQDPDRLEAARDDLVFQARWAMTTDLDYIASISAATSSPSRVRTRFEVPRDILLEGFS
jgi:hypothetical protein